MTLDWITLVGLVLMSIAFGWLILGDILFSRKLMNIDKLAYTKAKRNEDWILQIELDHTKQQKQVNERLDHMEQTLNEIKQKLDEK